MSPLPAKLRRAAIDVSALRTSPAFRRLFAAQLVSQVGSQVTAVALLYQAWVMTHSPLKVGLVGVAQVVPTVVFALAGGAIADAVDRRRLLLAVQVGMCGASLALAALATGSPPLWAVYALAAVSAALAAVDGPARTAVIPTLVDEATLRSAVQLREVLTQSGRVFGPVLAGALIANVSLAAAYAVDAATFVFAFTLFLGLPRLRPPVTRRAGLGSIVEGLAYVRSNRVLASTFVADLVAMVIGMPRALFPALALDVFGVGAQGLGYLYAAPAAGALLGLALGGLTGRVHREGRAVLIAVAGWGAAIALFGVTPWFWPAVALLAVAGWADMISAIFRQTILLATVPDELRGRMSSVHIMVVTGGPPLGDFEAGAVADVAGLRASIVIGGLGCVAGMGVLAAAVPEFRRWVDPAAGTRHTR